MHHCDRLSALDATLFHFVAEGGYSHAGSLSIIEGNVPFDDYVKDFEARIPFLPRLRQIVALVPFNLAYPTWEYDPNFSLNNHLIHVPLDPPGSWEQLVKVVSALYSLHLPSDRPLWTIHLITGIEGNRTGLLFTMHHAVSDGVGTEELQGILYGLEPPIGPGSHPGPVLPLPNASARLCLGLRDNTLTILGVMAHVPQNLLRFARWAFSPNARQFFRLQRAFSRSPAIQFPFNCPPSTEGIKLAFTQFNVEELRAIGRFCGATINDVLVAMVGSAAQRYAQAHGLDTDGKLLRVHMPVNMRRDGQAREMGNDTASLPVLVPMDCATPLDRVRAVTEFTKALKQCRAATATNELVKRILFCLTPSLMPIAVHYAGTMKRQNRIAQNGRPPDVNIVVSNVPRRPTPLYVTGHPILIRYAIGSPLPFIGMNCLAFTCGPHLGVSFAANPGRAPDLDRLCEFLQQAFDELEAAAHNQPVNGK